MPVRFFWKDNLFRTFGKRKYVFCTVCSYYMFMIKINLFFSQLEKRATMLRN